MRITKQIVGAVILSFAIPTSRSFAQSNEMANTFRDFELRAANGTPLDVAEAEPALEQLPKASGQGIVDILPVILHETSNPHLSVRRLAASALYQITTRPDGQALLSAQTAIFTALLIDPDIPIRRISMLAVATLRPNANSPIMPFLRAYLAREDAVSTIGPFVATVLMQAAPDDTDSMKAVVQFMHRSDQTLESEEALLNAIRYPARSQNRDIAREVARYADSPNEQISILAIGTLQGMGSGVVSDNQQALSRIEGDPKKSPSVRAAATKALSATP